MRVVKAAIPISVRVLRELRYRGMVISDRLVNGFLVRLDQIQTDTLQSAMTELQSLRSTVREVDDAARYDRSAVIDPDNDGFAVVQVGHLHITSDGKCEVGSGHIVHFVRFAAGGRFAFELVPVPRSRADLIRLGFAD